MPILVGHIGALYRYPVKSMAGEHLDMAGLGWHGINGDRRLAFRRIGDRSGFPWLTASKVAELLLHFPHRPDSSTTGDLPTHVRTPEGLVLELFSQELADAISARFGSPVEMTHLNRGIFDEASVSLISLPTIELIAQLAGQPSDVRRYRPNIVIDSPLRLPFEEDDWVGGILTFGDAPTATSLAVTHRDERCSMVNLEPNSAVATPEILKAIATTRQNKAGIYGSVTRPGTLAVGQPVFFTPGGVS